MRLPANSSGGSGGRHPRPGKLSWLTCGQMSVGKLVPRLGKNLSADVILWLSSLLMSPMPAMSRQEELGNNWNRAAPGCPCSCLYAVWCDNPGISMV
eukprot:jgi/Mesvir1/158/Mv25418-RA.1